MGVQPGWLQQECTAQIGRSPRSVKEWTTRWPYEIMYQSIPLWEKQTGTTVKIVYQGDGFAIDKKLKRRSSPWTGAACGHVSVHADPRRCRRAVQPDSGADLRRGEVAACCGRWRVSAS